MVKVSNEVAYCIKDLPLTSEDIGGDESDEGVPLEDDSWGECREEHGPHDDLFTADHVEQNGTEKSCCFWWGCAAAGATLKFRAKSVEFI